MKNLTIILISFIFISNTNADELQSSDVCHDMEEIILHKMNDVIIAKKKWEYYRGEKIMHKNKTGKEYEIIEKKVDIWKDSIFNSENILKEDIYYLNYYIAMCK